MRQSKIRARIQQGQPVRLAMMGHFVPPYVAFAAHAGYDGIWLDLEHHAMTGREVQALLAFFHRYDIDCIIRPPTREKGLLYRYLEDGAAGVMLPHVSTPDMARELVNKVRFPPFGDRGLAGFGFEANFGLDVGDLVEHANRETLVFAQIETPEAVDNVEAIAATPGLDGLYIGPNDLGIRLALQEPESRPDMAQIMARVAAACERHGKIWGIFTLSEAGLAGQVAQGARLLVWGVEFALLRAGLQHSREQLDAVLQAASGENPRER
ncbi:MAG: 4-hydroxy-2-oxovalerate aldolase [Anaerolineae bacterium]|nr:4-hydroxy-2-oxovalerate aldolase [Anaerolineae bacterium]